MIQSASVWLLLRMRDTEIAGLYIALHITVTVIIMYLYHKMYDFLENLETWRKQVCETVSYVPTIPVGYGIRRRECAHSTFQ